MIEPWLAAPARAPGRPASMIESAPFDGGPHYGAARDTITSVRERRELVLPGRAAPDDPDPQGPLALVSAEGSLGFRSTVLHLNGEGAPLVPQRYRDALGAKAGDRVYVTPLP